MAPPAAAPVRAAPSIFDRRLQRARLERARRAGAADFLLAHVAEDMLDRLASVKREFRTILDLGAPGPHLAQALAALPHRPFVVRAATSADFASSQPPIT